jgi:hypothetical protein
MAAGISGWLLMGTLGALQRRASLGRNFCAPHHFVKV